MKIFYSGKEGFKEKRGGESVFSIRRMVRVGTGGEALTQTKAGVLGHEKWKEP